MPAPVVSISTKRRGHWSLLEIAQPGAQPVPYGILLVDDETGDLTTRTRGVAAFEHLEEDEFDWLEGLTSDLEQRAREIGGRELLDWLEDTASNFLRVSDREAIAFSGHETVINQLFDEHVDSTVHPYITHLPVYSLRAAATKFGEGMEVQEEAWVRAPKNLHLKEGMFVAHVVGRSMEPEIADGSACVFRAPVTGARYGKRLLIEELCGGEVGRYSIKRYMRSGALSDTSDREGPIPLQARNPEFEGFDLTSGDYRVIAEFVQALEP